MVIIAQCGSGGLNMDRFTDNIRSPLSRMLLSVCISLLLVPLVSCTNGHQVHHHQGMRREAKPGEDPTNAFRDADFRRDREHIQEHMEGRKIDLANASPEELDFHFFKIHDLDNNNKLDGLELHSAMTHAFESQMDHLETSKDENPDKFQQNLAYVKDHIISSTDKILEEVDKNNDGFIVYMEYTQDIRIKNQMNHMARAGL